MKGLTFVGFISLALATFWFWLRLDMSFDSLFNLNFLIGILFGLGFGLIIGGITGYISKGTNLKRAKIKNELNELKRENENLQKQTENIS